MMVNQLNRIRWKCRRGMLELDLILKNFLETKFMTLSLEQQSQFDRLLDESDPSLYQWLTGEALPKDKALADMVKLIREN